MDRKHDRARKQRVRALAARTGLRYTQAARLHENGGVRASQRDWTEAGWARLLPGEADALEIVVASATFHDVDGDLDELIDRFDITSSLLDGAATVLRPDLREERAKPDRAFRHVLHANGISEPRTAGDLAEVLVALGLCTHQVGIDGSHRWRIGELYVTDELDLPDDWRTEDAGMRWTTVTGPAADDLLQVLGETGPNLITTPAELARMANSTLRDVRAGLEGLAIMGIVEVCAGVKAIDDVRDLRRLASDTAIDVRIDHTLVKRVDEADGMSYEFSRCPWAIYREAANRAPCTNEAEEELAAATLQVLTWIPFRYSTPYGRRGRLTLGQVARFGGMSMETTVETLFDMEKDGILHWNAEERRVELRGRQAKSLFSIDFSGQEG